MDTTTLRQGAAATSFAAGLALMALLRVFSPTQVGVALGLWLLGSAALVGATVRRAGLAPAALGALGGLAVVAVTVLAFGQRSLAITEDERARILPSDIRSNTATWEFKPSTFHSDTDSSESSWSYRSFFARRREGESVTVFFVVQSSHDESIPTTAQAISSVFWRLPI